jgi:hypothetical protein
MNPQKTYRRDRCPLYIYLNKHQRRTSCYTRKLFSLSWFCDGLELHNRTAKIESNPHRTRSGEGSALSLWNRTGFGFRRLEPIQVRLKPSVSIFEDLSDSTNQPSPFWIEITNFKDISNNFDIIR